MRWVYEANPRPYLGDWIQHLQIKDRRCVASLQIRCDIDNSFAAFQNFPKARYNSRVAHHVKIQKRWDWQSRGTLPEGEERTTPFRRYIVNNCTTINLVMKRDLLKPTLFRQYSIMCILLRL